MEASWLLPMRPVKKVFTNTPIITHRIDDYTLRYSIASTLFKDEESRQKWVRTTMEARRIGDEWKRKRMERSTKMIDMWSAPKICPEGKQCKITCKATLMNGLLCSSRVKFGDYCGRHKLV